MRPWISARVVDGVHGAAEFEQYGRRFRFDCDEAHERGGSEAGPSPMRYLLASIAFCSQGWIAKSILERGVPARVAGVDVRTILDMGGELGVPGATVYPPWFVVDVRIEDARGADPDALVLAVQHGVEHCPITSLVLQSVPVHLVVRTDDDVVLDDRPRDVVRADSTPVSR
ncbi:MAG: OsmC family protein [Microcella sp.]|uniref:OsmC family protein n=1 Tax=Microcella sp. TaxID=1913979 RepID=UPI003314E557